MKKRLKKRKFAEDCADLQIKMQKVSLKDVKTF